MKNNADGLIVSKTSLLPICAEISQIRLDATIEIAFAVFFKIVQFLRYASKWRIFMKRKMINGVIAMILILMLIINLMPDMVVALENIETLNGEVNLDFHKSSQIDEGILEIDGYHWEEASKTLTINGIKKFGIVILPQNCEVTVNVQGDDNYIENLQFKNKDIGIDAPIKVTFSGKGTLTVKERINMYGADNSSFVVADGVEFIAESGIGIGASGGVNSTMTVNGTLIVQTINEVDAGISAGMLRVGSTGKLSVSGNKGIWLNGINIDNNMTFENAFYIEEGGQFISDCTEFGIAVNFGNCGYGCSVEDVTDKEAEKMLVVPEIDLPVGCKVRVAKSKAYGEKGEEYYGCAITIAHEKADLKIDDNGRIVGSASSINIKFHNHVLTNIPSKSATCIQDGNKEYWICNECMRVYSDEQGTTLISIDTTVILALGHDFTGDFNAYNENSHWHICKRENCDATDEYQDHHFVKYEYNDDANYFADGTETAVCDAIGCTQTHTRIKENSKLIDSTAPTGEIKVNKNSFKTFINTITFGIFCNDKYDVTIMAEDNETGIEHIEYYISKIALSKTDIEHIENWTAYKSFSIENEGKYIIYAKITNKVDGVAYISSDGMVIDKTAPAIIGIENGKTYCQEVTFTIADDNIDYITIDGEMVSNVRAVNYTLIADGQKHTVKVCDKARNESVCTVTVNNGHTFAQYVLNGDATCMEDGTETAKCNFCEEKNTRTAVGSKHNHTMTYHEAKKATCTKEGNVEYWSCSECGKNYDSENGSNVLDNVITAIDSNNHTLVYHEARKATCKENGNKEYWSCDNCGKFFSNVAGTKEIIQADIIILALGHDFTGDFNAYNENSHWHICKRENCDATDEYQDHHFVKYEYNDDANYFADGTETAVCDAIGCTQTHTRIKENSKLIDSTAPTGEIKVNKNSFKTFINTITFGIFCNDKYDVTIMAEDNETGIEHIEYYISKIALSKTDIEHIENWTAYKSFSIENEGKYIIYAKITNKVDGVAYISSDGMVIDKTAPAIIGIENGKTYCQEVTFTIADDNIDYITIDGEMVSNVRAVNYTLIADGQKHTVKVCDKARNESVCTVTVNNGHTFAQYVLNGDATCMEDGTETAKCNFCEEKNTRTAVGSKHNHTMTYHEAKKAICTKEGNVEYWSCSECGKNYDSENNGSVLDNVITAIDPNNHTLVYHEAKKATCTKEGNVEYWSCSECGKNYDSENNGSVLDNVITAIDSNNHTLVYHEAKEATCKENGNKEYWNCDNCGKYFADATGTKEITETGIIIPAAGHNYGKPVFNWSDDGKTCKVTFICENDDTHTITNDGKITSMIKTNATCTKNGMISYIITVEFENKIYTDIKDVIIPPIPHNIEIQNSKKETCMKEGYEGDKFCTICGEIIEKGTIIPKLNHSYKDGQCTVCGLTDPDFKLDELVNSSQIPENSPQTSDSSKLILWFVLLFITGGSFAGAVSCGGKKK